MRIWLWTKIVLFAVFLVGAGLISAPNSVKEMLPSGISEKLLSYQERLGIDLSGGTRLEYSIDFSVAEKRVEISASDADTSNDLPPINKAEIADGVVKTLKRRIDPDGTKEVGVFTSKVGEEYHVVVELTSSIDTPENRAILEKVVNLEFKEPMSEEDRKQIADEYFQKVVSGAMAFEEAKSTLEKNDLARTTSLPFSKEMMDAYFGTENTTKLFAASANAVFPELLNTEGVFHMVMVKEKKQEEMPVMKAEKLFAELEMEAENFEPQEIASFPSAFTDALVQLQDAQISEVLEADGFFWVMTKLPLSEGEVASKFDALKIAVSAENAKEKAENWKKLLTPVEKKEMQEMLTLDLVTFVSQWKSTSLGGAQFKVAKVEQDQNGVPVTTISFDAEGAKIFGEITEKLSKRNTQICGQGDQFAIFVGGDMISAPCVREPILGGSAQISFGGTSFLAAQKEAKTLSEDLNSGATPAPIHPVSERKISPTLGEKALEMSLLGAGIGFLLIAIWMIFFYRFFGFLSVVALSMYVIAFVFILKFFGFLVLTLPGIAGIVLSVGMAVDANILIFERFREEMKEGVQWKEALESAFERAWTSIRDSNTSSLITCLILFGFGTALIKAFAIALALGILLSMFTAIVVTRTLIVAFTPKSLQDKVSCLVGGKKWVNPKLMC